MKQNTASRRIADKLRDKIHRGELRAGDRVPSARQIVKEHGVALATATRVLALLQRERLVRVVPGVGTVVRARDEGPDLSVDRIVRAAIAIADDEGLTGLSMRGVAAELGVATMSLYRHVPSKEDLVLRMIDAVMEMPAKATKTSKRGEMAWRSRLEQLARMQWETYSSHPWIPPALSVTRPQLLPNAMQQTESVLEALAELGLPPGRAMQTCVAFIAFVRGLAMSIESEREAEKDTGMSSEEWIDTQESAFATVMQRYPMLAKVTATPAVDMSLESLFERGLECFLDGLEAQAPGKARRGG